MDYKWRGVGVGKREIVVLEGNGVGFMEEVVFELDFEEKEVWYGYAEIVRNERKKFKIEELG